MKQGGQTRSISQTADRILPFPEKKSAGPPRKIDLILFFQKPAAVADGVPDRVRELFVRGAVPGTNCIKIGLPGKLILSKRKGLREVQFS